LTFFGTKGAIKMKKIWYLFIFLLMTFILSTSCAHALDNPKNQLIIVNKAINRLALYEDGELIKTFPVATGKTSDLTPEGDFQVIHMNQNPVYYKLNIPGGDPRNPLGPRWIGLSVPGTSGYTYGIHGNSSPWSIGTYASSGCVRMYNEDVTWLYTHVEIGARVVITRSSGSFDDIARNRGYAPVDDKAVNSQAKIILTQNTPLYERPAKVYRITNTLAPQTVQVSKQYKDWYYLNSGEITGWAKDPSINEIDTLFEFFHFNFQSLLAKKSLTYEMNQFYQTFIFKK